MKGDMHFSHDHPLSLFVDNKQVDDYEDKSDSCKLCGLPILSSPSYICTTGCGFFLHKCCAETFPQQFIHPNHVPATLTREKHTLHLLQGSPNFTYHCEDCDFQIHPLVAIPHVEIKTKHKSHPLHPLVAVCKQNSCECDACGKKHDGFFFCCQLCNFWIHQDCTILPSVITLASRPQPFLLTYSLPVNQRDDYCVICLKRLFLIHNAIYYCPSVFSFVHVSCAMEKIQSKTRLELIQQPDDDWETFPSLVIRGYSQSKRLQLFPVAGHEGQINHKLTIEKCHDHPLILVGDDEKTTSSCQESTCVPEPELCDVCIQTISVPSPYYRCALQSEKGCRFLAHKICADLLPIIQFALPSGEAAQLCPDPSASFFNAIFYCFFCHLPCNGPCYYLPSIRYPEPLNLSFFIDLECMAAPSIIKHASHSQHLLYRTSRYSRADPISCCASQYSTGYDVYRCIFCIFYIHVRCACLPKRVRHHEFDKHPLDLITTNGEGVDLCEVCETDVDLRYWHYHCSDCDYSFHINCIPKIGYLSKVKFGGTLSVPCHAHPLTLTRMLSVGRNEKCGHCNQIIRGFVDEMAFCCSLEYCGFWIHFSCARNSTASRIMVFGEVDEKIKALMAR